MLILKAENATKKIIIKKNAKNYNYFLFFKFRSNNKVDS